MLEDSVKLVSASIFPVPFTHLAPYKYAYGEAIWCNATSHVHILSLSHAHTHQIFSPANVAPPARMEPPVLMMVLEGTGARVSLATWVLTARPTSTTAAPTPATTEGHAR